MAAIQMGAVAMQPKMAEGASLFRPTLADIAFARIGGKRVTYRRVNE